MNEQELRQLAADAICARSEDVVIVGGIPEYWPDYGQDMVILFNQQRKSDSKLKELREAADVV